MSNADLIEQAREAIDNMDDFARMANVVATGPLLVLNSAIDALELADKRIAELEKESQFNFEQYQDAGRLLCEANEKLSVAREAMKNGRTYLVRMALINAGMLLQSGEFTTLVNDLLDEFINDHLHEVSDSESPISEFDWTRITIRKMGEALAQIGGEDARS